LPADWTAILDEAVAFRHELHRYPELTWAEVETARRIRASLDRLGIPWRVCAETGTVATLAANAPGRHVALRADIDALPIQELTGAAWASGKDGCMHACGHDGHTATLFAAASWLKVKEGELDGPVSLLFQPAEEGGHGAKRMIEDGALDGVDAIFGWHNWPAIPFGKAVCPDGPIMAANGTFAITVSGQGGHASQPELCRDPVLAASAITLALQQIISRRVAPQQAAVVSVTSIEAPSFETAIPSEARLRGSIRLSDSALRASLTEQIVQIAEDTARAYGVTAQVDVSSRYDATVNHPEEAAHFRHVLSEIAGPAWEDDGLLVPVMASEDFSYYLAEIPGAFALIGADDGPEHRFPCHSPYYDFNDGLIGPVSRMLTRLAGISCGK